MRTRTLPYLPLLLAAAFQFGQGKSLVDPNLPKGGWKFDNGREFPGATGSLHVPKESYRGEPVLQLDGNFTKGGNYVQAIVDLPPLPVDTLSFWINVPAGTSTFPIRIGDGSGQTHQLRLKLNDKGGWQHVSIPVDEYFWKMGTADALDIASQYEYWGGAKDAKWHQPGKYFAILCGRGIGLEPTVKLSGVEISEAAPKEEILKTVRLDDLVPEGETAWELNLGPEFKGAKGSLDVVEAEGVPGGHAIALASDFTGGGAYVGMRKSIELANVQEMASIRFRVKTWDTKQFSMRMVDGAGQTHQRKGIQAKPDGEWQEISFTGSEFAGQEHWGGANDGKWRGGVKGIEIMLNTRSNPAQKAAFLIADIRADFLVQATKLSGGILLDAKGMAGWQTQGNALATQSGLAITRTLDDLPNPAFAASQPFAISPGVWMATYLTQTDLLSPDNSYHVRLELEVFGADGNAMDPVTLGILTGKSPAKESQSTVEIPSGAAKGRVRASFQKTYGSVTLQKIGLDRLEVQPLEKRVGRILVKSGATGNLFFPGDDRAFTIVAEADKPLPQGAALHYAVRDYWGNNQLAPKDIPLAKLVRNQGKFPYQAEIHLDPESLQAGKFYQLQIEIPEPSGAAAKEFSGFAILEKARNKALKPSQSPFSIRNWDSRIPAYFHLADRIGIRTPGVWGGWNSKPPYKPHLPGLDLCADLDMDWITGTPAAQIERNGFKEYTEESLRQGMKNFLEEYADTGLAKIAMGNEPHGKGEKVLENIRAYRAIYETVKAFDPKIHVIGTSVEPNEEYFRGGYQNYLDSYDFHIYEHYTNVRNEMRKYRALMEKYDAVKPIHSTELGLNSQGQARIAVAKEMIKKLTSFFAEGGDMVAWFTIQYPDPKGKARGQFGDSHCMFDCKYSLYNPRLDAITHYHFINGVGDKKFAGEKQYPGGIQSYLFANDRNQCIQALWLDDGRQDILLPLPDGTQSATLTYIDGTSQSLQNLGGGITLTVSDSPILLRYDSNAKASLPAGLEKPPFSFDGESLQAKPGEPAPFTLKGHPRTSNPLKFLAPPLWGTVDSPATNSSGRFQIIPPPGTSAREAYLRIQETSGKAVVGEILVPIAISR